MFFGMGPSWITPGQVTDQLVLYLYVPQTTPNYVILISNTVITHPH